jgi:protein involved in polysaccharide export with SLBB domain
MPYDQVFVRKNPDFQLQQNIEIRGLVKYPGWYSKISKLERLSSFIDRAGGLAENADASGAVLLRRKQTALRETEFASTKLIVDSNGLITKDSLQQLVNLKDEPVSIDLQKALSKRNSRFDIVLQENDVIFIPEVNPFVNVVGKVQSSLKVPFDKRNKRLKYYIDKAGGFAVRPWRKRVYVTYANGKSRRTRNLFFIHFYPKVARGSIITVPARPEGQDMNDILKATISSVITVVTTAIIFKYVK